jgi:two-component system C4-dicarboxylate transport response regulator DctD
VPHTRLSRTGRIASSSGGTLLLDEIDSMPLTMQARLLRVLEEREVQPIGAERPEAVDLRVIATAKEDIGKAVAEGRFRADLYYRLATMRLRVPALRECTGEVFLLFAAFVEEAKQQLGTGDVALGPEVHAHLAGHPWPGNVRELKNFALEVASGRSLGGPADADVQTDLPTRLAKFEENLIRDALLRHGGRVSRALDELGVPRKTLYDKIARLGIDLAELRRAGSGEGR